MLIWEKTISILLIDDRHATAYADIALVHLTQVNAADTIVKKPWLTVA